MWFDGSFSVTLASPISPSAIACLFFVFLNLLFPFPGPLFVVVEYAAFGDLRQYLQERRPGLEYEVGSQSSEVLVLQDLLSFCYQVAKGMEFLSSRKVNTF